MIYTIKENVVMRQIIHQDGTVGLYCCGQLFLLLFEQNLHELFLAAVQNIHKLIIKCVVINTLSTVAITTFSKMNIFNTSLTTTVQQQ